jgi:hypothetical protein
LLKTVAARISASSKAILGATLLGDGIRRVAGNITDEMVQEYLEHHRSVSNTDEDTFILED